MNNTETKAAYKNLQITNVHEVIPISETYELAEICCTHENANGDILKYEIFFLNKNNQIAAYFETEKPVYIKHLNEDNENLFVLNYFNESNKEPYKLVRIEEDGTQTVGVAPLTGTYLIGNDRAGMYQAIVRFTANRNT